MTDIEKVSQRNKKQHFSSDSVSDELGKKIYLSSCQKQYILRKRTIDIVLSTGMLCLLCVPLGIIAGIQKIINPRDPVFFFQERVGLNERVFQIVKFRTMRSDAPHDVATNNLEDVSEYTTFFGRFLRKTSIDELPQLWNVIKGDMSLVGPRPLIVSEEPAQTLRKTANIYCIRPGITGLAQISGRDSIDDVQKVLLDKRYLEQMNLRTDIGILLRSVVCVFRRENIRE